MLTIEPSGATLGADIHGLDLAQPLADADFRVLLRALGRHGVLRIPGQRIDARALRDFSLRFGPIQTGVADRFRDPEVPEVGILSNILRDGQPIGLADAGQDWHTDMTYTRHPGFVNVLHAVKVPKRDGRPLGDTLFANMHAAYDDLPDEVKRRLAGMTATHDFNIFWERMRTRPGSSAAADRRAACQPAAGGASGLPDPPDHRPQGALLQPRLYRTHQRTGPRPKAPGCSISFSPTNCSRNTSMHITGRSATC